MATSSTVARWELAHRIKVRRNELGISVEQIAKHLGFTRNFFSAVENERSMLATDKLEVLLVMLEFGEVERNELMALDQAARQRGWWESRTDLLAEETVRFIGLEQGASRIRIFESLLIPGLLQTLDYARCVISADPKFSPVQVDDLVEIRLKRQELATTGIEIVALLSEAAVRQVWGNAQAHREQLEHINYTASANQDISIRILPFDRPPGMLVSSSTLVLLDFPGDLPSVAYQEALRDFATVEEGTEEFRRLNLAWEDGERRALDPITSRHLIADVAASGHSHREH